MTARIVLPEVHLEPFTPTTSIGVRMRCPGDSETKTVEYPIREVEPCLYEGQSFTVTWPAPPFISKFSTRRRIR